MDASAHDLHGAAHFGKSRTCVIGDLIFSENTAGDLTVDICQRFQRPEHLIKRIVRQLCIFRVTAVVFRTRRACQKSADGEEFHNA